MTLHWITDTFDRRIGLKVQRAGGPRVGTETAFWFQLKRELKNQFGFKSIKKCPAKDGHLTSAPYYLRTHKGDVAIHDSLHQIRSCYRYYNDGGDVVLSVEGPK